MINELKQAITLIKSGEKQKGGQILAKVLKAEPQNELAWLWMSQTVNTQKQQRYCLEQVLAINPGNKAAQKALAKIERRQQNPTPSQIHPRSVPPSAIQIELILIIVGGSILLLMIIVLAGLFLIQPQESREDLSPLIDVCRGKRIKAATPYLQSLGKHPTVGVEQGPDGLRFDMFFIPDEVRAQSITETELVVCLGKVEEVLIESCPYKEFTGDPFAPGPTTNRLKRYYYRQDIRIITARTGLVIAQKTFTGKSPRRCRTIEEFREDEKVIKLKGTPISDDEVQYWVRSYLIVE